MEARNCPKTKELKRIREAEKKEGEKYLWSMLKN